MSPPEALRSAAAAWLDYAEGDLEAALACQARPSARGWTIAFHCQQAVEKAYKGALLLAGQPAPRTHSLVLLDELLIGFGISGPIAAGDLDLLTPFAVSDKYPILTMSPIGREDASAFLDVARAAVHWLRGLVEGTN